MGTKILNRKNIETFQEFFINIYNKECRDKNEYKNMIINMIIEDIN